MDGTEYHLWFLPFLLTWSIALLIINKCLLRLRLLRWPAILIAVAVGCVYCFLPLPHLPAAADMTYDDTRYAWAQWFMSTAAALWAMAFAWFMAMGPTLLTAPAALGWAGLALVIETSMQQAMTRITLAPRGLSGLGSMLIALTWRSSWIPALARFGRRGYGIYLCHVIPVEVVHVIIHRVHPEPTAWLDILNFAISFPAAWGIVVLLDKSPRLAWLNG